MGIQDNLSESEIVPISFQDEIWLEDDSSNDWIVGTTYQQVCGVFDCAIGLSEDAINSSKQSENYKVLA